MENKGPNGSIGLKVIVPSSVERIDKQLRALKAILNKDSPKDKIIHKKAIAEMEAHREKLLRGN